ncbi:hypothetical protein GCK32_022462 [Trichostrongylus colubriformis]|uniref:Uncharacterized protein n=1 Tax=Trichostrongylus colubriformis TaxID=6319 RepID=A0AAN8FIG9_TRICO
MRLRYGMPFTAFSNYGIVFQIASKSSSDGEDPLAHGLDPSLYGPNAPITCASPCTSDAGAVPSSSSFSGSEPRPTGLGLLHCLLQHFPVRKRLRVSILKIEGEL